MCSYMDLCVYTYLFVFVCACACVCVRERVCVCRHLYAIVRTIHAGIIENQSESLFTYSSNQSWADYYDPSFSPVFVPTFSDPDLEEDAREICGGDTFCLFDIAATKRIDIGISTMQGNQDLERITELSLPGEWKSDWVWYMHR